MRRRIIAVFVPVLDGGGGIWSESHLAEHLAYPNYVGLEGGFEGFVPPHFFFEEIKIPLHYLVAENNNDAGEKALIPSADWKHIVEEPGCSTGEDVDAGRIDFYVVLLCAAAFLEWLIIVKVSEGVHKGSVIAWK